MVIKRLADLRQDRDLKQKEVADGIGISLSLIHIFIMSLDEAVDLVLFAFEHGEPGDILVQKAPALSLIHI